MLKNNFSFDFKLTQKAHFWIKQSTPSYIDKILFLFRFIKNSECSVIGTVFRNYYKISVTLKNLKISTFEFYGSIQCFSLVFLFCQLYFTISQHYFLSLLNVKVIWRNTEVQLTGEENQQKNSVKQSKATRKLLRKNLNLISATIIQGVSTKTFEPNNSVIFQRIFVKFKMQIF
jgi:hypothetical protein